MGILKAWGTLFTVNPIYCLSHAEENLYCEFSLLRRREGGSIHIYIYNHSNELGKNKMGVGVGTQTRSMQGQVLVQLCVNITLDISSSDPNTTLLYDF